MNPNVKASLLIGLASLGIATASNALQATHSFDATLIDKDRDGVISTSELDTHADMLSARVDLDRNGQFSRDEQRAFHVLMAGAHGGRPMNHGEGHEMAVTTPVQFREALRRHATSVDGDHNGLLTVAELSAAMHHGPAH